MSGFEGSLKNLKVGVDATDVVDMDWVWGHLKTILMIANQLSANYWKKKDVSSTQLNKPTIMKIYRKSKHICYSELRSMKNEW